MLVQCSLPSSIEVPLYVISDHGKDISLCDWMTGRETWPDSPNSDIHSKVLNIPWGSSCWTLISNMSESSLPNIVYHRKKLQNNSATTNTSSKASTNKNSEHCSSSVTSNVSPKVDVSPKVCGSQVVGAENVVIGPELMHTCDMDPLILKPKFINGCSNMRLVEVNEVPERFMNDSSSSSKFNVKDGFFSNVEVDDTCESSSSQKDMSVKDFCIDILRQEGLLGTSPSISSNNSFDDFSIDGDDKHHKQCKFCGQIDLLYNMIVCDECEEAFHISCCNFRVRKMPVNEWFCTSCLKNKHKIFRVDTSIGPSPISSMLNDRKPYTTKVRVGKGFQANVPEWTARVRNENNDCVGESLEMGASECKSSMPHKLSPIGNWLQCQEVIEGMGGVDRNICGKWRRAPLFEVQTDDWDCFASVHWDPTHADCAVPQELDTDEVLKQLKYIELLRPRLAVKRQKLNPSKINGP